MFLLDKKMFSTIKTVSWLTLYFMLIVAEPEPIKVANNFANKQQEDGVHIVGNSGSNINTNGSTKHVSIVSQHKDFFQRHFDATEYEPRMEVIALGLDYNNETATLSASIFVGVPTIDENLNSKTPNYLSKMMLSSLSSDATEKFTSYEIYLTAVSDDGLTEPPSSCLSDAFLQHSCREVLVGCPRPNERLNVKSDIHQSIIPGETSCTELDANNFTVVFRHVYSAYYCILIQPQVGTHTRRTFSRMAHYQTSKRPSDITEWQTTIDLQPLPRSQSISAAFTLPDPSYQIISRQLQVDLLQVSGELCNDPDQIKVIGTKIVVVEAGIKAADIEFVGQSPGLYCIVVIPVDERCDGNNFWKTKGRSCARHSAKSVRLQASPTVLGKNDGSKTVAMIRTPTLEIWATFTIICAFFIGLALFSLLGTVVVYRRRHKKQLQRLQQRRQHQLLLEWGPTAELSPDESSVDSNSLPSVNGSNHVSMVSAPMLKVKNNLSTPISVLLLYRRDDAQTAQYSSDLRKKLQSDCGDQIKVYDYGDETQWEDMATEGLDWLPNRICGNGVTNSSHLTRIIVIHSPMEAVCSLTKYEQQQQKENDDEDKNTSPLLFHKVQDSIENNKGILKVEAESLTESISPHSTADHEFLYGMQLLKSFMRDSIECCASVEQQNHASSLYRRVFNVRYTSILDCTLGSEKENQNTRLVYPHLDVAPFTCYILPGHYNQLLQHLTSP